ncbi:MAG TPA: type II toxin-antitoxin system VapC family toxin [Candidatus Bathyarchaeia archaeon]
MVVDASILVKWFVDEEGSEEALRIRRRYVEGEAEIVAPELIMFEALNALRFKGLFTAQEVKRISESLDAYAFDLRALRGQYAAHALEAAYENDLTLYDASYISLASLEGAKMYTADRKLIVKLHEPYLRYVKDILEDAQN